MSNLNSIDNKPKMLSERSFGLIFSGIFLAIAMWPMLFGSSPREWALITAGVWAVAALIVPIVLRPLNILWMYFGLMMHKIVNPILMGLVFFIAVFPTGLILKILGKDPMRRKFDSQADSYWIARTPDSQHKEHFDNQF